MNDSFVFLEEEGEIKISDLTKNQILSQELLVYIFDENDIIKRTILINEIGMQAKSLKCKTEFNKLIGAAERAIRSEENQNFTKFPIPEDADFHNMACGSWITKDTGEIESLVYGLGNKVTACLHPVLPIKRMVDTETGEEQVEIAFRRNGYWRKVIVPKDIISSANKITGLSKNSMQVTSENAKALVRYLSEVEHLNEDEIPIIKSSTKLGWHKDNLFLPYDDGIMFSNEGNFREILSSIKEQGNREKWLEHIKKLRQSEKIEIKLAISASLASPLIEKLESLPFIVDFYGITGSGKTVMLMVAASCWANPAESKYIGNFRATPTALEVRADMLNNLPMILDDTSNANPRIKEDYESTVYILCNGKGRSRSNINLGVNNEKRWSNCIITNGERPLSGYAEQGGGINRIIECRCVGDLFEDPKKTVSIIEKNYGFAGKEMVEAIKQADQKELIERFNYFYRKLDNKKRTSKQIMALATILVADKIATEFIFKDGLYLSAEDAAKLLVTTDELSDNVRCYRYICDKVEMNLHRFHVVDSEEIFNTEMWGSIQYGEEGTKYAVFFPSALEQVCKSNNFSKQGFVLWAVENGIIEPDNNGKNSQVIKINGKSRRGYWIKMNVNLETGEAEKASKASWTGMNISETQTSVQEEIPFDV